MDFRVTSGFTLLQTNADASLLSGNFGANTLRQSILGVNQGRNLLDLTTKTNADASLLSGNFGANTLRQSILGANQGRNLLQNIATKVSTQVSMVAVMIRILRITLCVLLHELHLACWCFPHLQHGKHAGQHYNGNDSHHAEIAGCCR